MGDAEKWQRLVEIMAALRGGQGCPWDKEQDHRSLKRYLLEEAYETLEAIDRGNDAELCDELGDVLLQVVFHARIAEERGAFTIDDVVEGVSNKMVRRHPHIFAQAQADNAAEVLTLWEAIKAAEKCGEDNARRGLMRLNDNLPALMLAQKAQDKAARVGFDWPDISGPRAKLAEELRELEAAQSQEQALDELGDVLFSAVNLARFYGLDAEDALRHSAKKFIARFNYIEAELERQGKAWGEYDPAQLDQIWEQAKEAGI